VTRRITSDALVSLNRMLGVAGPSMAPTDLDDQWVSQVVDVTTIVRRSRTPAGSTGWYYGLLQNAHAGAGALTSSINAYDVLALGRGGYPSPIPRDSDVWLLSASLVSPGAAGGLDGAALNIDMPQTHQGWGRSNAPASVTASDPFPVARWTALDTSIASVTPHGITGEGGAIAHINQRLVRDTILQFQSDAAAAATFRVYMVIGVFTEGLGQDIAS